MLLRALRLALRPQPFVPGPHVVADEQRLAVQATFRVPRVVRLAPRAAQERLLAVVHLQGHSGRRAAEPRRGRDLVVRRLARAPRAFELEEARQPAGHQPATASRCAVDAGRVRFFAHSRSREISSPMVAESGKASSTAFNTCACRSSVCSPKA